MSPISRFSVLIALFSPFFAMAAGVENDLDRSPEIVRFVEDTERAFDRSGKYVSQHVHADGSQSAEYNGSMQNVTVARRGTDGKIETFCTTDQTAAIEWMTSPGGGLPYVQINRPVGED